MSDADSKAFLLQQDGKIAAMKYMVLLLTRILANNMPGAADELEKAIDGMVPKIKEQSPAAAEELEAIRKLIRNPPDAN